METLDKIVELLHEQNKNQKDLTDFIGLTKNTFTNWKLGTSKSYKKHIDKIAAFFGVSTDYLLNRTNIRDLEIKKSSADNGEGNIITHKIAAMGGMDEDNIRTLNKEQMNKWAELIEATRDLPPEKIDMLIKMAESIK